MSYDLTSLFTTVAAASASIVAILGGFIASKLISIAGERKSVLGKMDEVEEQLKAKREERNQLQERANEDAAVVFIRTNVAALISGESFDDVMSVNFSGNMPEAQMREYWEKASSICNEIVSYCKSYDKYNRDEINVNQHNIPIEIAKKYHQDYFAYNVCREVGDKHINQIMYWDGADHILQKNFSPGRGSVMQAMLDTKQFSDIDSEIKWLQYRKKELEEERIRLSNPEGMKMGVVIFALFSLLCIVFPLLLSPFTTNNACTAWLLKLLILVLFAAGLTGIILYLVSLLRWKENKK